MSERKAPTRRSDYGAFWSISTRWHDNDVYGHVNNVVYYSYFDTAVNGYLIERGVLDFAKSDVVGLVIHTSCTYFLPLVFPDTVAVGLKVTDIGTSSVRYEIGLFRNNDDLACAIGEFVHVYVDRIGNRPVRIPDPVRAVLMQLAG